MITYLSRLESFINQEFATVNSINQEIEYLFPSKHINLTITY